MKHLLKLFLAATLGFSSVANAGLIVDADFQFGWGGSFDYSGSISGEDANNDGFLTTGELTAIFENLSNHTLPTLTDIGDIDIANQTWIPNGIGWTHIPDVAFMTFDNRAWSCNTSNGCNTRFTSFNNSQVDVPEPETLALLALGLLGFSASRQKKNLK